MRQTCRLRAELVAAKAVFSGSSDRMVVLESRCEDAEKRLRRSNFIFYGFHDSENETGVGAKKLILYRCSEHQGVNLDAIVVERAQRLGRYGNKLRPIIVKFTSTKLKDFVLSAAFNLKGARFLMSEDFSPAVRESRRTLLPFAKSQDTIFKLSFNRHFIGDRSYTFDAATKSALPSNL